jgi:hypothetical protein
MEDFDVVKKRRAMDAVEPDDSDEDCEDARCLGVSTWPEAQRLYELSRCVPKPFDDKDIDTMMAAFTAS